MCKISERQTRVLLLQPSKRLRHAGLGHPERADVNLMGPPLRKRSDRSND